MSALSFRYRAIDPAGGPRDGSLLATNRQDAFRKIAALGLTPMHIEESRGPSARGGRIKPRDIAHFTTQLAVLLSARIPIGSGLLSIAEQERNPRLRAVINDVAGRIEAGDNVAAALSAHPSAFGPVYVETVRAAERSGSLVKILDHLGEMLERDQETRRQIRSALMYPACVLAVLAVGVTFLIGFVVPKFSTMFAARGVDLPVITQVLVAAGHSVQGWWWAQLLGIAAAVMAIRASGRSPGGKRAIERLFLVLPVIKDLLGGVALARFARVFGVTLTAGLPLTECLDLAGRASGLARMQDDARTLITQVSRGGHLGEVLPTCSCFTPFARRMLIAGEESAELPRMCATIASHYDKENAHLSRSVSALIEPLLVVMIAGIVLVVALGIFMPMWEMVNLVR